MLLCGNGMMGRNALTPRAGTVPDAVLAAARYVQRKRHGAALLGQKCKCTRTHGMARVEVGWRPSCPTNEASQHAYNPLNEAPMIIPIRGTPRARECQGGGVGGASYL